MEFPLIVFLYIYYAFLLLWAILFFIALYHMFRFGFRSLESILAVVFFIGIAGLMLDASFQYINKIDWQQTVTVFKDIIEIKLPI